MANMKFFFLKNIWYFIVADWPTGGEDKIKHNGATDLQASNFVNPTIILFHKMEWKRITTTLGVLGEREVGVLLFVNVGTDDFRKTTVFY